MSLPAGTRLGPSALASDAERLARFQREAEILASLNHPRIAAVYGLEDTPAAAGPFSGKARASTPFPLAGWIVDRLRRRRTDQEDPRVRRTGGGCLRAARRFRARRELGNGRRDLLFFRRLSAAIRSTSPFRADPPRLLFEADGDEYDLTSPTRSWDATGDGQRFLLLRVVESTARRRRSRWC